MKRIAAFISICLVAVSAKTACADDPPVSKREEIRSNFERLINTKQCPSCDLSGVMLNRVDLSGANLEGAVLIGASLYLADLSGANLRNANLLRAGLGGADLGGADLRNANLRGAVLEGAYLGGAQMEGSATGPELPREEEVNGPAGQEETSQAEGTDLMIGARRDFEEMPPSLQGAASVAPKNTPKDTRKDTPKERPENIFEKNRKINESPAALQSVPPVPEHTQVERVPVQPSDVLKQSKKASTMADAELEKAGQKSTGEPAAAEPVEKEADVAKGQGSFWQRMEHSVQSIFSTGESTGQGEASKKQEGEPAFSDSGQREEQQVVPEPKKATVKAKQQKADTAKLLRMNQCVACDLADTDLTGKNLDKADLERAQMQNVILKDASLESANLKGADLSGADLRNTDLRKADLYRANLSGADLTGARLKGALIDLVDFSGAIGVNFDGAIRDE